MVIPEKTISQDPKKGTSRLKTNAWGVDLTYKDSFGNWHDVKPKTISAVLEAMGAESGADHPPVNDSLIVMRVGERLEIPHARMVRLENGGSLPVKEHVPADIPPGYHRLHFANGREARLIISPGVCWLPKSLHTWGWAVQLYAARSNESWGIGDLHDLDQLASWSARDLGAGMMLVNPLSAPTPVVPQQASPYYPTSRQFFNPLWIHIEAVPGCSSIPEIEQIAKTAKALNSDRHIQRDRVLELKMRALDLIWQKFTQDHAFDEFCWQHGHDLETFARYCALAEHYRSGWHSWPEELQHPSSAAVKRFAEEKQSRVRFYKWLQWLIDGQLARCSANFAVMQDLPIGVDPDGADAWAWQDVLAPKIGVGAPPDEFNTQGQNWGLPPFVPHKLRAAGYEPFIKTIRAVIRNGGGLRIDHVMGLFRLFWIPSGMSGAEGTYVRYNADEMLAIVALESQRARAYVVGEDLGTVEDGVRENLARHAVMSYRLLWFEKDTPESYPHEALAAITTHDLPTVSGLWTGSDLKRQKELKLKPNEESTAEIKQRLAKQAGLDEKSSLEEVVTNAYKLLASAPSRILTAALDDALLVEERPNMPAADKNPNWCIGLPRPIEDLMQSPVPAKIAAALRRETVSLSSTEDESASA